MIKEHENSKQQLKADLEQDFATKRQQLETDFAQQKKLMKEETDKALKGIEIGFKSMLD